MRVLDRLEELYAIGGGPGANRVSGTPAEDEAHALAAEWMRQAGLTVEVDPARNLIGRSDDGAVWTGSHLDSVPKGGKFDGALGVVAGIEAVERLGRGAVVAFRGEEAGCVGSRAFVADGGSRPSAFLELHVEQGPVLDGVAVPLGAVSGIVGYARGELVFQGRAGHAGTPMDAREDALVRAAVEILRIRDAASSIGDAVATVGRVDVDPGATNVVPGTVRISVDVRAPDAERLELLVETVGLEPTERVEPIELDEACRAALRAEIAARGLTVHELPSGAGHDAGILAAAGVPSAMLFVRSLNGGASHCPEELSSDDDVALAVDVLTAALGRIASSL